MTNPFAIQLIEQPGEETTALLFDEQHTGVVWIDWREADDDIIAMIAETLSASELSCVWQEGKLSVCYKNQMTLVPLNFEPGEQDKTLLALNQAIAADYEIRYINASAGGDTLGFMVLETETWKNLESQFSEKVAEAFMSLTEDSALFS